MTQDEIDKLEVDLTYQDEWATVTRDLVVKLLTEYKALQRRVEFKQEMESKP